MRNGNTNQDRKDTSNTRTGRPMPKTFRFTDWAMI